MSETLVTPDEAKRRTDTLTVEGENIDDGIESGVEEQPSPESYRKAPESAKDAYVEASVDTQLTIDRRYDMSVAPVIAALEFRLDSAAVDARAAGADGDTLQWVHALSEKLGQAKFDIKDMMIAGGDVQTYLDALKGQLESSIAGAEVQVQTAVEAAQEERRLEEERKSTLVDARDDVQSVFEAKAVPNVDVAQASSIQSTGEQQVIEASKEDSKPEELGFFAKRRLDKARGIYAKIDGLEPTIKVDQFTSEADKRDAETAANYRATYDKITADQYVPSGQQIKSAEKHLQDLQDKELKTRADRGDILSKEDKKRLSKLQK